MSFKSSGDSCAGILLHYIEAAFSSDIFLTECCIVLYLSQFSCLSLPAHARTHISTRMLACLFASVSFVKLVISNIWFETSDFIWIKSLHALTLKMAFKLCVFCSSTLMAVRKRVCVNLNVSLNNQMKRLRITLSFRSGSCLSRLLILWMCVSLISLYLL